MSWSSGLSRDGDSLCCARRRQLRARSDGVRHLSQHLGVQGAVPEAGRCRIHCEGGYQSHSGADHGAVLDYHLFTILLVEKNLHTVGITLPPLFFLFYFYFFNSSIFQHCVPSGAKRGVHLIIRSSKVC